MRVLWCRGGMALADDVDDDDVEEGGDDDAEGPRGPGPEAGGPGGGPELLDADVDWAEELGPHEGPEGPCMVAVELDGGGSEGVLEGSEGASGVEVGKLLLEELGAPQSRFVTRMLAGSKEVRESWGDLAGSRMAVTGTKHCSACQSGDHDRLMMAYWRGELTADEAGAAVGVGGDRWTQHMRKHVPNYQVLRELAAIGAGPDMRRLLVDLRDEALRCTDEYDRMFLLRQNIVVLRTTLCALVSRGITSNAQQASSIRAITHEIQGQARELHTAEIAAAEWAAGMRRERAGDGWAALDSFKADLDAILSRDPELCARVNDLLEAEGGDQDAG